MISLQPWSSCEKQFIRKVEKDEERVLSIIEMAQRRHDLVKTFNPEMTEPSFIIEQYYEVIKELLVALLLRQGFRSSNHQCLFSFFAREHPAFEFEAHFIAQLSFYRNRLDYYGEKVPSSVYEENKKLFEDVITLILKLLGENKEA